MHARSPVLKNVALLAGSLNLEGRKLVCAALVAQGRSEWLSSDQRQVLVLWHTLRQWADKILAIVRDYNLKVMTLDDVSSGDEVQNTGALCVETSHCLDFWPMQRTCSAPASTPNHQCCASMHQVFQSAD